MFAFLGLISALIQGGLVGRLRRRFGEMGLIRQGFVAVAAGLAVGMKIHAGVYFAPVVVFHCLNEQRGFKTFAAMAVAGLAVVLLPFAFSVFSLSAFAEWIVLHIKKGKAI